MDFKTECRLLRIYQHIIFRNYYMSPQMLSRETAKILGGVIARAAVLLRRFCFVPKQTICFESICIFASVRSALTMHYCKAGQSTHPRRAPLRPLPHCLMPLKLTLCIMGQHHDNNSLMSLLFSHSI